MIHAASLPCATRVLSQPVAAWVLASLLMSGCAAAPEIPPWFDAIQRISVHTASVNGHRIAYLDEGQGPPLILLHGYGGSMWQWEYQRPLTEQFRVITPDLIGSGLSDKPDIDYRPQDLIDSVSGLMDSLGLPTATLVGSSMGAGVALGLALTHPERIDGFPDHVRERLVSPLMRRALDTHAPAWLARFGASLFGPRAMEAMLKEIVYDHSLVTPLVIERSNRNRQRADLITPLLALRDSLPLWEQQFAPRLSEIRHPALILWGEQDRLFPPQVGRDLQTLIPRSRLILIPNAGHIPQWEQPQAVNRHITEFLHP